MSAELGSLSDLSADDRELLDLLLAEEGVESSRETPIPRRAKGAVVPLSYAQQRLWFLERLESQGVTYNLASVVSVAGFVALPALAGALAELVRRHEVLRTTFRVEDGAPIQIVGAAGRAALAMLDLAVLDLATSEREAKRVAFESAAKPFDLERGPLFRTLVVRRVAGDTVLLLVHHTISDGWSQMLLVGEIQTLYGAAVTGRPSPLPEPPIQYGDFAIWQREQILAGALGPQIEFWRSQLAGVRPLNLPVDRPCRPRSLRGGLVDAPLPVAAFRKLVALSEQEGATSFMGLLAIYAALLARSTHQEDFSIGTPRAGRTRLELEPLVGFFANNLVLRQDLSSAPSLREILRRTRRAALAAYGNEDVPFDRLVDALHIDRDPLRTPLFDVVFAFQNAPLPDGAGGPMAVVPRWVELDTAKFDLSWSVDETSGQPLGTFEYRCDLFDAATVERLAGHLRNLLASGVEAPDVPIGELNMLSSAERLEIGRPAQRAVGGAASLPELFSRRAALAPDAIAVVASGSVLSYGELLRRATGLASRLAKLGVRPGDRVALCLERSLEMPIAILGTLLSGAAYLPIEPSIPDERRQFLLADGDVRALVVDRTTAEEPAAGSLPRVAVEEAFVSPEATVWVAPSVPPAATAYVIYTSGSTGTPKGVAIPHENVGRLFEATEAWFGFAPGDTWTLFHSYSFDFSVWEIWGALLYGGRLVVVPQSVSRSPTEFRQLLLREQVTMLSSTPSAFRQLQDVDLGAPREGAWSLRTVVFGGEALDVSSLRPWFERHGDRRPLLVNMYGITETTVHVTYRPIRIDDLAPTVGSAIGVPIPDLTADLLGPFGEEVPFLVPGEMLVGGDGLASGYLGRPDLTATRFVPDPFGRSPGARLYRSGDLSRRLPGGQFEYLGRVDHQVKIRGFRIELGEIEAALRLLPGMREAKVLARDTPERDKHLVAYLVCDELPAVEELRARLRSRLPDYMVPAAFVRLDAFPLTANGKLAVNELPLPLDERPDLAASFVGPRSPMEEALAAMWSRALGLAEIGVHDNFFALGGDSILAVRVAALAEERGLRVTLAQLFAHQTVADLSSAIEHGESEPPAGREAARRGPFSLIAESDRALLPADIEDAYPLSSLQAGMLFHMALTPDYPLYHNVNSFRIQAPWDEEAFDAAVQRVVARHPVLRTSFDMECKPEPLQRVHRSARLSITFADLRSLKPDEQAVALEEVAAREKLRPFDLSSPPLLRFLIHRRNEDTFQFTLVENHAILDGWSLQSTLAEIFSEYRARLSGKLLPEPVFASTFREFIRLEREALSSAACRSFWERKLEGASAASLPRRTGVSGDDGKRIRVRTARIVGVDVVGLVQLARAAAVPLKSVLLAAHVRLMGLMSGQTDVLTGLVTNGRAEELDGERIRGLFLNTVPLRTDLGGGTWEDLVRALFRLEAELMPFRRFPLAEIQKQHGGEAFVETCFNYVHFHVLESALKENGLVVLEGGESLEETNFQLLANFLRAPGGSGLDLTFSLQIDGARIEDERSERIFAMYLRALQAMAAAPDSRYELDGLLAPSELAQAMLEGRPAEVLSVLRLGLHQRFERCASRCSESTALVCGDRSLTYGELDRRAERLAQRLVARGAGPEVKIGISVDRNLEMVIGLLAILKSGAIYVPLDPAYPRERQELILADSGAALVVAESATAATLPSGTFEVMLIDGTDSATTEVPRPLQALGLAPEQGAYLIYTSGSTGKPKGVLVSHANAVRLFDSTEAWFDFGADRVWTLFHSYAFDFSVWEIWSALLYGGKLVVVPREISRSPEDFFRWLVEERVTDLSQTPSAFRQLVAVDGESRTLDRDLALRAVVFGGEALDLSGLKGWFDRRGDRTPRLVNMYGITETTVHVTYRPVGMGDVAGGSVIGRPIPDLSTFVLDAHFQIAPTGVPGEIFVGGSGVARGYFERPELTAIRFVPDPWSLAAGGRLYRSGDLARRTRGGDLEYLGRIDHQVKIRGFRIELGEIEASLQRHPAVREAVVLVRGVGEDRSLIGFCTCEVGERPGPDEIKRFLAERLPSYSVPTSLHLLDALPVTASGKVDRRKLLEFSQAAEPALAPRSLRTPTEAVLAAIWSKLLGGIEIGSDDNFFALGGHSLMAMRVMTAIRERFGTELELATLFESPTLADLAHRIEGEKSVSAPILAVERGGPLPVSFIQRQLWIAEQLAPGSGENNIPIAVRLRGGLSESALAAALAALFERHEVLRSVFVSRDGEPFQLARAEAFRLPVLDLSALSSERRERDLPRVARAEAQRSFDLARGPLCRTTLVRCAEQESALLVVLHHAIADGPSIEILLGELFALYDAGRTGRPAVLAPTLQYADYAAWQRRLVDQPSWHEALKATCDRLRDLPEGGLFGTQIGAQSLEAMTLPLVLDDALAQGIRSLARDARVTPFVVTLAAYLVILRRISGKDDLVVGSPVSLRDRAELERVIGPFLNLLILRCDLAGDPSFAGLLGRVRDAHFEATARREVPYDAVVEALAEKGKPDSRRRVEVAFTLQGRVSERMSSAGLEVSTIDFDRGRATFDLTLNLVDTGERFEGFVEFRLSTFSRRAAESLIEKFQDLLAEVIARPEMRLSDLQLRFEDADRRDRAAAASVAKRDHAQVLRQVKRRAQGTS